jgi:hypothetical protein
VIRLILGIGFMVVGTYASAAETRVFDICAGNDSQFVDMVGGAALGSSITASVAGQSVLMIVTQGAALIVSAPAVAPAMATTAVVGSSAYVFMKGYCNSDVVRDIAKDLHQSAVDGTVETVSVVAGTYEIAVQQTSEKIEVVADVHEIAVEQQSRNIEKGAKQVEGARGWLTDVFCSWDEDCK